MKKLGEDKLKEILLNSELEVYRENKFTIYEKDGKYFLNKNEEVGNYYLENVSREELKKFLKQLEVYFLIKEDEEGHQERLFEGSIASIFDKQEEIGVSLDAAGADPNDEFHYVEKIKCKPLTLGHDGFKYFIKKKHEIEVI